MTTIKETIKEWMQEYDNGDTIHKYLMYTELLLNQYKIESIEKQLKTRKVPTGEEYLAAFNNR